MPRVRCPLGQPKIWTTVRYGRWRFATTNNSIGASSIHSGRRPRCPPTDAGLRETGAAHTNSCPSRGDTKMMTREENELMCRVAPGTPMGQMLREYWAPALRSQALEADGAPVRVRMLGENYIAFRASDGRVGFFDEGCPHRCTSLALARNEDNALTCIFHGWKIDVSGKVVEVPSEPPERRAEFAAKVRVKHYPVREAGRIIWVYLGKSYEAPQFPDFNFTHLPPEHICTRI